MEILWLAGGFVAGGVVAWITLFLKTRQQVKAREAELLQSVTKAEDALSSEKKDHQKTQAALTKAQTKETAAKEQAEKLEADLEKSAEKLKAARSEQRKVKRQLTKAEKTGAEAGEKLVSLEADLEGAAEKLKVERNEHKNTKDQIKQQILELKSNEASAVERAETLEAEVERLRAAVEEAEAKAETGEAETSGEVERLQAEVDGFDARIKSEKEAQEKIEAERMRLEDQLKHAQNENRAVMERGRARIGDLQEAMGRKDAEIKQLQARLATVQGGTGAPQTAPPEGMPDEPDADR